MKTCVLTVTFAGIFTGHLHGQSDDPIYTTSIPAYGIHVQATQEVPREWLSLSAIAYEHLTDVENEYTLRETLAKNGFRILLIGEDRPFTDLPEFANDPDVANAGGLGGNPGEPFIGVRAVHPHVLVHELAHGIYHTAVQFKELGGSTDPQVVEAPPKPGTFTHELIAAYNAAMEAELWKDTYFEAHPDEYWAEGVTLFFRVPERNFTRELKAEITLEEQELLQRDTRAFLKAHDPRLYALVRRVFPESNWQPMAMFNVEEPTEERTAIPDGPPDLAVRAIPEDDRLTVFRPHFDRFVNVFGVVVVATPRTEEGKIVHAANVLAQYLDNDEDGRVDDPDLHEALLEEGAHLVMFDTENEAERLMRRVPFERLERAGFHMGQGLYGEETLPKGPPHVKRAGRFDASLEEVLHLVSNGYGIVYPDQLGYEPGTQLTNAMDTARGGHFPRVPRRYPDEAWYHYDDRTCDYQCMAAEYLYWAITTLHGAQDYPGRAREIANEWETPTPELLRQRDTAVVELLEDPAFRLPSRMPDGTYRR